MSINFIESNPAPEIPFSSIIKVPNGSGLQSFISISDIKIDPSTIPESGDVRDALGVITLKLHFYVNTKVVLENEINEISFSVYDRDPSSRAYTSSTGEPGGDLVSRDPLSTRATIQVSNIVKPIRTTSIRLSSQQKNQKYDLIFSNENYNNLPVVGTSNTQPYTSEEIINTSISLLESEKSLLRRVIFSSYQDPIDYINWRYFKNSNTIDSGESIVIDRSREFTNFNYISLSSRDRQKYLSQKNPDTFTKNSDINLLYQSSPQTVGSPGPSLRRSSVSSNLREYQVFFNIQMKDIDIRTLEMLYVETRVIDARDRIRSSLRSSIRALSQIQSHITPVDPASIKVSSQTQAGNTLLIKQHDYLANSVTINRMIISPNYSSSTLVKGKWKQIAQIPLKSTDSAIMYVDRDGSSVSHPDAVIYEAVISGPGGTKCPVSSRVVCPGRKRNPGAARGNRSQAQAHCTITSYQGEGNTVVIAVSDIPAGISKLSLRRQIWSTALRQNDSRYHDVISTPTGQKVYHVGSENAEYQFIDTDVQDRVIYRYYVEFDTTSGKRIESARDEIIEFRSPPATQSKIQSGLRSPQPPTAGNLTTSFTLDASFNSTGLSDLNKILQNQGTADLFKSDFREDRNQISKLLVFEVTRKNTRTGEFIIWPSISPGQFVDNNLTRSIIGKQSDVLVSGDTYVYTAKLLLLDPEALFTSAKTSKITADGLRKIQISAKKFAENFSISPGKMQSPTTISRSATRDLSPGSYFTGISHNFTVKVPKTLSPIVNLRVQQSLSGRPANVIRWSLSDDNIKNEIYSFRVDVITNRDTLTPLMTVSPNSTLDGTSYEVRDEINVNKLFPVQYRVSTIKSDMSRDAGEVTGEIINKSSYPIEIVTQILFNR